MKLNGVIASALMVHITSAGFELEQSKASCESADQIENMGNFASREECALEAQSRGYDMFMFADWYSTHSNWGCRACHRVTGNHNIWSVYRVVHDYLLVDDNASCEGADQIENMGMFPTIGACAHEASKRGYNMFMFADGYSSTTNWGCRACNGVTGDHNIWSVYKVAETCEVESNTCAWQTSYSDMCVAWACCYQKDGGWNNSWCRDRKAAFCNSACGYHQCNPQCPSGHTCGSSGICRRTSDGACFNAECLASQPSRRGLVQDEKDIAVIANEEQELVANVIQTLNETSVGETAADMIIGFELFQEGAN